MIDPLRANGELRSEVHLGQVRGRLPQAPGHKRLRDTRPSHLEHSSVCAVRLASLVGRPSFFPSWRAGRRGASEQWCDDDDTHCGGRTPRAFAASGAARKRFIISPEQSLRDVGTILSLLVMISDCRVRGAPGTQQFASHHEIVGLVSGGVDSSESGSSAGRWCPRR